MLHVQPMIWRDLSVRSVLTTFGVMSIAVFARAALDHSFPNLPPFITLYPAVVLAGLLCGPLSTGLATAVGIAVATFFWIPPRFSLAIQSMTAAISIGLFTMSSFAILIGIFIVRAQSNAVTIARQTLDLGLTAGGVGTWELDLKTMRITASSSAYALHGLPENNNDGTADDWLIGVHRDDIETVRKALQAAVANGSVAIYSYRICGSNGELKCISARGRVVSANGATRLLCALIDITDQVRVQDELRELATARELLIREADHRIKNSLQMITALLTLQLRGIDDPDAAAAIRSAITRVDAVAASHLALQGSEDFRAVDMATILKEVCGHFSQLQPNISITCRTTQKLMLDADRAIPLGLAVSEVITNALRHGFAGRPQGEVSVDAFVETSQLTVRVCDNGIGMKPQRGQPGLGSRIIRALVEQLAASIEVDSSFSSGTSVTIRLPFIL